MTGQQGGIGGQQGRPHESLGQRVEDKMITGHHYNKVTQYVRPACSRYSCRTVVSPCFPIVSVSFWCECLRVFCLHITAASCCVGWLSGLRSAVIPNYGLSPGASAMPRRGCSTKCLTVLPFATAEHAQLRCGDAAAGPPARDHGPARRRPPARPPQRGAHDLLHCLDWISRPCISALLHSAHPCISACCT